MGVFVHWVWYNACCDRFVNAARWDYNVPRLCKASTKNSWSKSRLGRPGYREVYSTKIFREIHLGM